MQYSAGFLSSRTNSLLHPLFDEELHAKTLLSLHNAVLGSLHAARAGVAAIGQGLALAQGKKRKHAIKQVDRLLNNSHLDPAELTPPWLRFVLAGRREIVVVVDWTDFAPQGHHTLCLSLVTSGGRTTPLLWQTVTEDQLTGQRNSIEDTLLERFAAALPTGQVVRLYARRFTTEEEFRDQKNLHLGMGLSASPIQSPERRDRLLLVIVLAQVLLHVLGAAGESLGLDRGMEVNTRPGRGHSLLHQGSFYYHWLSTCRPPKRPHCCAALTICFESTPSARRFLLSCSPESFAPCSLFPSEKMRG